MTSNNDNGNVVRGERCFEKDREARQEMVMMKSTPDGLGRTRENLPSKCKIRIKTKHHLTDPMREYFVKLYKPLCLDRHFSVPLLARHSSVLGCSYLDEC